MCTICRTLRTVERPDDRAMMLRRLLNEAPAEDRAAYFDEIVRGQVYAGDLDDLRHALLGDGIVVNSAR